MTEDNNYNWLENINKTNDDLIPSKNNYIEPDRVYDDKIKITEEYISSLPDLQNGPSSLIQGSPVEIQQVGIHNFKLPLKYLRKDKEPIELETSITGTVSLEAHKKGINMSRIIRSFYEYKDDIFDSGYLENLLKLYKKNLNSFHANINLKFRYPIIQESLRSQLKGYQYYDISIETAIDENGIFKKIIHFDFVYSSACPCSFELAEHARKHRNKATVSHSQRSVARISIETKDHIWFEEIQQICLRALKTETQVMVKREDEQAFAELNGSNLKFVEDAARLLFEELNKDERIIDFKVVASHNESLHAHNAIAVIIKGIKGGFTSKVETDVLNSLGLR